jgi:hypothetical protein
MTAPNRDEPPPGWIVKPVGVKWWWDSRECVFVDLVGKVRVCGWANTEPEAIAAAWAAYDRIHGKTDQLPDATKMIGSDHSVAPNDMTSELAEALENCVSLLEHATCESGVCMCGSPPRQHKLGCEEHGFVDSGTYNQGLIIPAARAVLEKYRATRKEKL